MIRSGQRVRVTAQLLEARTDRHIWAETYDGDRGDVLKLQAEVAGAIAQQVRAQITPEQHEQMSRAAAPSTQPHTMPISRDAFTSRPNTASPRRSGRLSSSSNRRSGRIQILRLPMLASQIRMSIWRMTEPCRRTGPTPPRRSSSPKRWSWMTASAKPGTPRAR